VTAPVAPRVTPAATVIILRVKEYLARDGCLPVFIPGISNPMAALSHVAPLNFWGFLFPDAYLDFLSCM